MPEEPQDLSPWCAGGSPHSFQLWHEYQRSKVLAPDGLPFCPSPTPPLPASPVLQSAKTGQILVLLKSSSQRARQERMNQDGRKLRASRPRRHKLHGVRFGVFGVFSPPPRDRHLCISSMSSSTPDCLPACMFCWQIAVSGHDAVLRDGKSFGPSISI